MLGSFLEGAKATVRRAGAVDQTPASDRPQKDVTKKSRSGSFADADQARVGEKGIGGEAAAADNDVAAAGRDSDVGFSAAESVSRSFSLLRASGARVMLLPMKKALGGDPEVVEARARLTKYKATLSSAVAEAAAAAATRREERDLLTKALAVQENDLRCWGYLSVLPSFREHRRLETNRAQLRVSMSERREEVMTAKLQEVVRLLRSMPIIGPWTNKPRPSPETEVDTLLAGGAGARDGGSGGSNSGHGNGGGDGDGGRFYLEESFEVAPADLLAFDEHLALTRRRLVLCDRACAAAADAFAMKVVDAGGLEPRSTEDRGQTLLSLLSRYHNLEVEEATAEKGDTGRRKRRDPGEAAAVGFSAGGSGGGAADRAKDGEGAGDVEENEPHRKDIAAKTVLENTCSGDGVDGGGGRGGGGDDVDCSSGSGDHAREAEELPRTGKDQGGPREAAVLDDGGRGDGSSDDPGTGRVLGAQGGGGGKAAAGGAGAGRFSGRDRKECEEAFLELMLDERNREGRLLRRFLTMAQAKKSPTSFSSASSASSRTLSISHSSSSSSSATSVRQGTHPNSSGTGAGASASSVVSTSFAAAAAGAFSSLRWRARGGGNSTSSGSGSGGGGGGHAAEKTPVVSEGSAAVSTNATAETAHGNACKGTAAGADPVTTRPPPRSSAGGGGVAGVGLGGEGAPARCEGSVTRAKEEVEKEEEDWEEEGTVGPQVVKAFINYFSKEYLVKKFDVPDFLVPSLTELVALLVFRQARRLVFGYDRRRVMRKDLAWREKAEIVRSVPLLELGAPPEYVPTLNTKTCASSGEDATIEVPGVHEEGGRETKVAMVAVGSMPAARAVADHPSGCDDAGEADGVVEGAIAVMTASEDEEATGKPSAGRDEREEKQAREDEEKQEDQEEGQEQREEQQEGQPEEPTQQRQQQQEQEEGLADSVPEDLPVTQATPQGDARATGVISADVAAAAAAAAARACAESCPYPIAGISGPPPASVGLASSSDSAGIAPLVPDSEADSAPEAALPAATEADAAETSAAEHGATCVPEATTVPGLPSTGDASTPTAGDAPTPCAAAASTATAGATAAVAEGSTPILTEKMVADPVPPSREERPVASLEKEGGEGSTRVGEAKGSAARGNEEREERTGEKREAVGKKGREAADPEADPGDETESKGVEASAPHGKEEKALPPTPPPSAACVRASREFGRLGDCATPAEMLGVVKSAMTLLSEDAARISESDKPLDADTLLPLLVHALAHANLPRVHEALNFLGNFRGPYWGGEHAYYVTCIEAAVSVVLEWTPSDGSSKTPSRKDDQEDDHTIHIASSSNNNNDESSIRHDAESPLTPTPTADATAASPYEPPTDRVDADGGSDGSGTATTAKMRSAPRPFDDGDAVLAAKRAAKARAEELEQLKRGQEALMRLGIFLEKHEVQEDTVDVLSSAGWM